MYFWINFSLWILSAFLAGIIFALAMEPRWPKVSRWALAVLFTLFLTPVSYAKITHTGMLLQHILYGVVIVIILLYLIVPFKEKLWKKTLLFII